MLGTWAQSLQFVIQMTASSTCCELWGEGGGGGVSMFNPEAASMIIIPKHWVSFLDKSQSCLSLKFTHLQWKVERLTVSSRRLRRANSILPCAPDTTHVQQENWDPGQCIFISSLVPLATLVSTASSIDY